MWLSILYTPKLAAVVIRIRQSAIINPVTSEGEDANTTLDVGIPIEVDITPDDALLQSSILVSSAVKATGSTATGRVGKMEDACNVGNLFHVTYLHSCTMHHCCSLYI